MKLIDDLFRQADLLISGQHPYPEPHLLAATMQRAAAALQGLDEAHTHEFDRATALEEELERYKVAVFKISACRFSKKPFEQIDMILKEMHDAEAV